MSLSLLTTALLVIGALPVATNAALTDIATTPLASTPSVQVKSNIMLLMDASGSMGWGHMPDEVETVTGINSVGYKSSQCNSLYYNPKTKYLLPKKPDPLATPFAAPSFTAAPYAGFVSYYASPDATDSTTVDLSQSFRAYDAKTLRTATTPDTAQPAYYYVYTGPQTLTYASAPCTDLDTYATDGLTTKTALGAGGGTWTRVTVSATSGVGGTDERANFAMWYSFYRIRISMIKSAASIAFNSLSDSYRVGFILMQPKDVRTDAAINPAKFLALNDFNATQRGLWFSKLFSQTPSGASPAREGLARVGRYYASKEDSINTGMPATGANAPVQYSCQRNFTIMTTDGYWNAQTESPNGGALDINGQLLTTSQDSDLSNPLDASPIYDGSTNGTKVVEDNENSYAYASCGSFAYQSTVQYLQSTTQNITTTTQTTQSTSQMQASTVQNLYATSQNLQSTTQTTSSTSQNLQSTTQRLQSTIQNLQSTSRNTQSTSQNLQSTQQNLQSTTQNLKSTSQNIATTSQVTQTVSTVKQSTTQNLQSTTQVKQSTTQTTQSTTQRLQSTTQNLQSTSQNQQSTTQTTISTAQRLQSTTQALQSTLQTTRSTTQTTQTTSQPTQSTSQLTKSTSQLTITTTQITQTTVQDQSCDASTELCTYVPPGSCTAGGYISCQHYQSGPALVASCTPTTPTAANNYLSTTCATSGTGPTGTSSCTAAAPSSSNNYTRTTCNTTVTSNTPTGSCTAASANSGNAWTTTTCNTVTTGPTIVSSCTPSSATSSNNYVATTCGTATTGPTGVASCTASGPTAANSYTTTTCGTNNTTNVPVASCSASGPAAANNYTTTTCGTNNTTNVPVASCAAASPTSSNNYTTITCSNNNTSNVPVSTCTASGPTSANGYVTTTCTNNNTGPTGTASCTPITATSANSWTTTTCGSNNTTNVGVSSCSPSGPSSSNGYTTTTCSTATTTNVPVATCTASSASSSNNYVTTTCSTNNTTNVPVASCTASAASSSNNYTKTTCANNNTGPTGVASCSAVTASSANNYTATTCGTNNTTNVAVASCTASGPTSSNAYTTTTCTPNNTTNVPVATCTASSPTAANSYVTTTCGTNNTSNVLVASCTPATASSANNYTTTTCATTIVSGPTVVASCTPSAATAANNYQTTSCGTTGGSNPVATCVPSGPTAANNYTTTTCGTTTTTNIPVATCTASGPTAANNYTTTTCSTNNTTNVPVATCTASAATAANNYVTTTCPAPVTTGPTAVASCTPVAATSGNNYVATTCSVGTTGPTAVASCTPVSPTSANAYTTTSCGTVVTTNVPVASCTPSGPTSTNSYTTTTCSTNNTTNVPVASCTGATPTAANNYTRTICSDNNTSNVAVATCTASSPTSANGYTTTTCSTAVTAPVGVASCTPIAASSANNYTATTCGTNNTNNVPVASCTPSGPTSANGYTTTTCPAPATTGPTPIATCTASAATAANNWTTTTCPAPITTTGVAVSSCTPAAASSANNYTTTTCAAHNTGPTAVSSCTPSAATSANNWTATTCNTTPVSTATASCTASGPTAANNYTTTTCSTNNTSNVPVASCTASSAGSGNAYTTTSCSTVTTGPTLQPSCVPDPASAANNYTATTCNAAPGTQITYTTRKTITTTLMNGNIAVGVPTVQVSDTGPFTATQCFSPVATPPALPTSPSPSGVIASLGLTLGPVPPATCSQWPCTTSAVNPPTGSINSLADVAQYYYVTNLRPDLTPNKVKPVNDKPAVESDDATWPHMTTFAVGLGVAGTLTFDPNYRDVSTMTKDFADIRTGAKAWPLWPDPAIKYDPLTGGSFDNWNDPRSIDDFWHAAVNGRGQYFSAKDPTAVVAGLTAALGKIEITTGTGAGAATSSQAPVAGDNSAYVASYQTATWSGEVEARPIDLNSGAVNLDPAVAPTWSAQTMLAKKTGQACDNRLIYLFDATATNNMVEFTWNTSSCDSSGAPFGTPRTGLSSAQMAYFGSSQVQLLSQYASMTDGTLGTVDQRTAATGANLVNFLRGQRGLEKFTTNDLSKLYRSRVSALGDFINSQPVYVKAPSLLYQDAGYSNFVSAQAGRTPMVYVGGNDGMLHAFYAGTSDTDPLGGQEAWAMIPSTVLPNLYKLADANYGNTHQYFVDGTPTVGDISDATGANWKTMLVGGLNSGGKGYYAIDVTDPLNPKAMWEFKASGTCYDGSVATAGADCFIGYTYGQPIITKIADPTITTGRWVVILTSGYNNVHASPTTGDGIGYLYVLDAATGKILYRISTGVGSATTPSGLAQISGYANNAAIDNTSAWVYGGDLLGNIWRFDVNNAITPAGRDATLLGQAKDPSSNPQPITVRPELGELNGLPMVFVGTGRFLGATDVTDTQIQSVYGIVDTLSGNDPVYADLRTALKPLVMTQTGSGSSAVRTIACSGSAAECTLTSGWRIDLDAALAVNSNEVGERVNVPLSLVQGTLIFASNVPSAANAACEANGHGWLNYVNFSTGFAVGSTASSTTGQATGGVRVSDFIDGGLITGFTPIYLPSTGKYRIVGITSGKGSFNPPPPIQPPPTTPGRISWREVAQ